MVGNAYWQIKLGLCGWPGRITTAAKVPHGANTANVKKYIDFAAKYGFDAVLVEGWNTAGKIGLVNGRRMFLIL
jgi:hypothetical protein